MSTRNLSTSSNSETSLILNVVPRLATLEILVKLAAAQLETSTAFAIDVTRNAFCCSRLGQIEQWRLMTNERSQLNGTDVLRFSLFADWLLVIEVTISDIAMDVGSNDVSFLPDKIIVELIEIRYTKLANELSNMFVMVVHTFLILEKWSTLTKLVKIGLLWIRQR